MVKINSALLLLLFFATALFSQISWTSRVSGTRNEIRNVTYGNNLYVAAGVSDSNSGALFTSPDAITWTVHFAPIDPSTAKPIGVIGVAYGNSQYVAVGVEGVVLTSPTGATWTILTKLPSTYSFYNIIFGNNQFVAVGWGPSGGVIYTSPDGLVWTMRTSGTTNYLNNVTYGNNLYVAVGGKGTILTSSDGIIWANKTSAADSTLVLYGVTYGNNQYVAVGNSSKAFTSPDGAIWTQRTTPYQILNSITYGNSQFVAAGGAGQIFSSPNAVTWTARTSGLTASAILDDIMFLNNQFIAVGIPGAIITSPVATSAVCAASKPNNSIRAESIRIYTMQGRFIAQKRIVTGNYLDGKSSLYKNLSRGTYLVRIPGKNSFLARRISVE